MLDRRLHPVERTLHAAADVDREDQIERRILTRHAGDRLLHAVLGNLEILRLQPAHELPVVGHDHRDQHRIGADPFREAEILGPDVVGQPAAVGEVDDDPHVMGAHDVAWIPGAGERRALDDTGLPAVDGEGHGFDSSQGGCRLERDLQLASGR